MIESVYWIWFQLVFGIGTRRAELMLNHFKDPKEIYDGVNAKSHVLAMLSKEEKGRCEAAWFRAGEIKNRTLKKGVDIITPDSSNYPELLKSIYTKPAVLYVKGDIGVLRDKLAIATVGTRKATDYGKKVAKMIAGGLGAAGAVVVSGLAAGIDTECHEEAVKAGGRSIGILGCGIDVDYPKGSAMLKRLVCENGAVVTEYPLGTKPFAGNFPTRNRIISGMSYGVVVIEADVESGSLITANHALEQGRDVFAVPGSVFSRTENGAHKLIGEGAKLTICVNDILEEYAYIGFVTNTGSSAPETSPSEQQAQINNKISVDSSEKIPLPDGASVDAEAVYGIMGLDAVSVEQIAGMLDMDVSKVLSALTELEIYGVANAFPGRKFKIEVREI